LISRIPAKGRPGLRTRLANNMLRLLREVVLGDVKPHDSVVGFSKKLGRVEVGR
jgi:hypothetical protein